MRKGFVLYLTVCLLSFLGISSVAAEVVRGEVTSVDSSVGKLSVALAEGETLILTYDPEDFIVWEGDDEVEAKAIKIGSKAEVGYYTDEEDVKIASWLDLTPIELDEPFIAPEELMEEPAAE